MSQELVRAAFEVRLKTWADAQTPAIPVAWQNVVFDPPEGRYVRAFLLPSETQSRHLSRTDRSYAGLFQVSLCMPIGKGIRSAEALAGSLDAHFPHTFTQGALRIWLLRPFSIAAPLEEGNRIVVPVTTQYEANVV